MGVFASDVEFFREQCDASRPLEIEADASAIHRAYVRAVFALIEALLNCHKCLLLDLSNCKIVDLKLGPKELDRLREKRHFMTLEEKVKTVYKAAGNAFGAEFSMRRDMPGWSAFTDAIEIRNRITHPKSFCKAGIQVCELITAGKANEWFRNIHNEYVRLASAHQKATGWELSK